jgi:PAS domain S-box-containing protein
MRSRLKQTMEQLQVRAKTIEEKNVALDQSLAEISRMRDFTEDVLSSIDGGVITFGLNARVTKINEAARRILGLDSEDSSSQIPPVIVNIITEVMTSGRRVEHEEMEVDRPDGTKVPIDLSVSFLKSQERNIGVVATFYDLTQVRALQERVRRQEHLAALGTLSAGIAHEIRNPLGIIKGAAEILQKRFGQHEDEEGLSGFIIEEVKRLSTVVTEFLDFARPKEPHFRPCSLNDVIKRSLRVANLPAVHPKVQTELELDQLPQAEADPEQCQQALINLILNAAQAMPEGGGLCIRSRHEADNQRVIIEVMDTGQGIDSETRSRIFNPFFTTKDEGTGLGLSIVHRIVENHKAHISVESTPGEGCTFRIAFPVNLSPEEENPEGMQNTAASSNIEAS